MKIYKCKECGKEFTNPKGYAGHMGNHKRKEIGYGDPWNKDLNKDNCEFYQFLSENYTGREVWNTGLKKETDLRVAIHAKSISIGRKKYYTVEENLLKLSTIIKKTYKGEKGILLKERKRIQRQQFHKENPKEHVQYKYRRKHLSRNQKCLYSEIKKLFSPYEIEIEYPITTNRCMRYADVAVPRLKLDFELDESAHNYFNDKIRDQELKQLGWTTIRITGDYDEQRKCFVRAVI